MRHSGLKASTAKHRLSSESGERESKCPRQLPTRQKCRGTGRSGREPQAQNHLSDSAEGGLRLSREAPRPQDPARSLARPGWSQRRTGAVVLPVSMKPDAVRVGGARFLAGVRTAGLSRKSKCSGRSLLLLSARKLRPLSPCTQRRGGCSGSLSPPGMTPAIRSPRLVTRLGFSWASWLPRQGTRRPPKLPCAFLPGSRRCSTVRSWS